MMFPIPIAMFPALEKSVLEIITKTDALQESRSISQGRRLFALTSD